MEPIDAVVFDFHSTLVDNGDPRSWLVRGLRKLFEKDVQNDDALLARFNEEHLVKHPNGFKNRRQSKYADLESFLHDLHRVWDHAKKIDPKSSRDLSPELHRSVFHEVMKAHYDLPEDLANSLYDTLTEGWIGYEDSIPVLKDLQSTGIRLGLISNVGMDIRPTLKRENMLEYFDSIVLSCEMDEVKPARIIFEKAMKDLGVDAKRCLMVGDDVHADGGAALLGMRTLIIPKTIGRNHGLELVSRICLNRKQ